MRTNSDVAVGRALAHLDVGLVLGVCGACVCVRLNSPQAFLLTLRPVLDTLRRHGCCVFLRHLPGADFAVGHGVGCAAHRGVEEGPGRRGSTTLWSRGSPGEGRGGAAPHSCAGSSAVYRVASSPLNTVRMPTRSSAALRWKLPPARRRQVRSNHLVSGLTNLIVS